MSTADRILELIAEGGSVEMVAAEVGVSQTRVYQVLKANGVPTPSEMARARRLERTQRREEFQKRTMFGPHMVRCRRCKKGGRTNLRVVGRTGWIDLCGACRREVGEA